MSKYHALSTYLCAAGQGEVALSFSDLEEILGFPLPPSACRYPQWWQNGGHTQARAWMDAGFVVQHLDLKRRTVRFVRNGAAPSPLSPAPFFQSPSPRRSPDLPRIETDPSHGESHPPLEVCGYEFQFVQALIPECEQGVPRVYYPHRDYVNRRGLPLLPRGGGPFCRFSIQAPQAPGVYLWVAEGQLLYIGETVNLRQRFNTGYGAISPRNCYAGGQSTNCKMNQVVLDYYNRGTPIQLYFFPTQRYKQVELELLGKLNTPYNVKDN